MGFTNDQAKAALELSKNNLVINYNFFFHIKKKKKKRII